MTTYPGAYLVVDLGSPVAYPAGPLLNLSGLNLGIVMAEEDDQPTHRFFTWGLPANSAMTYQSNADPNMLLLGVSGSVYKLTEESHTDDGLAIPLTIQTGPWPVPDANAGIVAEQLKRIREVHWQIATEPPAGGHLVTATVTDVDNANNYYSQTFFQKDKNVRWLAGGLKCRQCRLQISLTTNQAYDIVSMRILGQALGRPYTTKVGA